MLTKYSLRSGGVGIKRLMGGGSLSYLLELEELNVTVGPQINNLLLAWLRDMYALSQC